jgi:hypothetical protein
MDSLQLYSYEPIAAGFIRLLELNESDCCIGEQNILQGTLKKISTAGSESFDAVSYVCGSPEYTECILIGDKKVMITKNCCSALRHLRDQFGMKKVWVDAVCINGKNKKEKSDQIPSMTNIYGRARRVYVWLGEPSDDGASDRALDWLRDVSVQTYPYIGIRLSNFPTNTQPREIAKLIRIFPDIFRAGKYSS